MLSARGALVRRGQFSLRGGMSVGPGELHALVGRNGAGKTTWLRMLAGQIAPAAGEVLCGGEPCRPPRVAYLPARAEDAVLGARRLLEVDLTLSLQGDARDPAPRLAALERLLDISPERVGRSGEIFLRALLGLLAMQPSVLLLDEPTSRLDPASRDAVFRALRRLRQAGVTVVAATHDPELARGADRMWLVADGAVAPSGLEEAVARGALRLPGPAAAFPGLPARVDASGALRLLLRP